MEYLNAFLGGLVSILPPARTDVFLVMPLVIGIGFAVGSLPGMGGVATMALMLPFIFDFDMDPSSMWTPPPRVF